MLTSTVEALRPRIDGAVDLLLFNPPYVATTDEEEAAEQARAGLGGAWAGGTTGTRLLDTMIKNDIISVRCVPDTATSSAWRSFLCRGNSAKQSTRFSQCNASKRLAS